MTPQEAIEVLDTAVQNGMAFMERNIPGWFPRLVERVQVTGGFSIASCYHCALSTAANLEYGDACRKYRVHGSASDDGDLGFFVHSDTAQYDACLVLFQEMPRDEEGGYGYIGKHGGSWAALTFAWEWAIMQRLAAEPMPSWDTVQS